MRRSLIVAILVSLIAGIGVGYTFCYREILGLQSEISSLESGISTLTTDYDSLNTKYNQCLSDYDSLESSYCELQEAYELLTEYYISLNSIYSELQGDYEEAQVAIAELEQMVEYEVDVLLDREYYYSMKNDLENANDTVLVAMYSMAYDSSNPSDWGSDLIVELVNAKDRGVNVTVIIENRTFFGYREENLEAYQYLSESHVHVKFDDENDTDHVKLVIIDDSIVYVGSHNWSESGLYYNRETSVKIVSQEIADIFKVYFETI